MVLHKPGSALSGEADYDWLPGRFFLVGREIVDRLRTRA
jgi:hypothetical protein